MISKGETLLALGTGGVAFAAAAVAVMARPGARAGARAGPPAADTALRAGVRF